MKGNQIIIASRARLAAGWLYLKRTIFWNSTLHTYLTGDFFARQCEYVYRPSTFRFVDRFHRDVASAKSIFCQSHNLELFLKEFGDVVTAKVLVLGNSDRDFNVNNFQIPESIQQIYAQNLNFVDERFKVLPIGLENMRLGRNLFVKLKSQDSKVDKILIGPFSMTHDERLEIAALDFSLFPSVFLSDYVCVSEYRALLAEYRFVLCPRGNGLDTHRFWEVLYCGGIPIVQKSVWSGLVKNAGLPVIEIEKWTAQEISDALLNFGTSLENKTQYYYLTQLHWKKLINPK